MFIHERDNWTDLTWDANAVLSKAAAVYKAIGFLGGRLSAIGFDDVQTASAESLSQNSPAPPPDLIPPRAKKQSLLSIAKLG